MDNYCIGIIIVVTIYLILQLSDIVEGLDLNKDGIPDRVVPDDLKDIIRASDAFGISSISTAEPTRSTLELPIHKTTNQEANFAKSDFSNCVDSPNHGSCNVATPSPESIDMRYVHLPSNTLSPSDEYNVSALCPQAYSANMDKLRTKQTLGQYSGYTSNGYLDRTRYLKQESGLPLPVNPDFFESGGGTYA